MCAGLGQPRNNTLEKHSITPVFSLPCVEKKPDTLPGSVVFNKSATNLNIFNYSACCVAPVVLEMRRIEDG